MMSKKKLSLAMTVAIVLAPYAVCTFAQDANRLSEFPDFNQALAQDYAALAEAERAQGDRRDAETYAARAAAARNGSPTAPDQLELRQAFLKEKYVPALADGRQRLLLALNDSGRSRAPRAGARAQASFDCWLEQAAEDLQPEDIEACRQSFLSAVTEVEKSQVATTEVVATKTVTDPDSDGDGVPDSRDRCPGTAPGVQVDVHGCPEILLTLTGVNFKFDSSEIESNSEEILNQAVAALNSAAAVDIRIEGHTDSTGSDAYNQKLSQRRAAAVQAYLVQHGIPAARLSTEGKGESQPVAPNTTAEGRYQNRRVDFHVVGQPVSAVDAPDVGNSANAWHQLALAMHD